MRIVLIDEPIAASTGTSRNRFAEVATLLRIDGHEAVLLNGAPLPDPGRVPPILTGLNRAVASAPLIEANGVAHYLLEAPPDILIAPLRGGIAQGVLMARACGEGFTRTRVALWCGMPSVTTFQRDDDLSTGLGPLVADALERQAFMLADALIVPNDLNAEALAPLGHRDVPCFYATLPPRREAERSPVAPKSQDIAEIVFAGPMTRRAGLMEFIEVITRLWERGLVGDRTVTFLGSLRPSAQGIGSEWLGMRAATWPFPFKVLDLTSAQDRDLYLSDPRRLAVAISDDTDELPSLGGRHIGLLRRSHSCRELLDRLEKALTAALQHRPNVSIQESPRPTISDWPALVGMISGLKPYELHRQAPQCQRATVCILHHNRLEYLSEAIASIPDEIDGCAVDILVLDNASDIPFVDKKILSLARSRQSLRVLRFEKPLPQAAALNRALAESQSETILFLDDDNYFAPDGVQRLIRAIARSGLDIVVTPLDIFDDSASKPHPSVGRLIFLGAAHSAGLFFNAFGDTAMAVRRESFIRLGGFHDPGYFYPCLDWVTLAKAQASGLRIGALQCPAVRYRRNIGRSDVLAHKLDQEGARSLVFEAYGTNFNAPLLARYAQKLQLEEL